MRKRCGKLRNVFSTMADGDKNAARYAMRIKKGRNRCAPGVMRLRSDRDRRLDGRVRIVTFDLEVFETVIEQ